MSASPLRQLWSVARPRYNMSSTATLPPSRSSFHARARQVLHAEKELHGPAVTLCTVITCARRRRRQSPDTPKSLQLAQERRWRVPTWHLLGSFGPVYTPEVVGGRCIAAKMWAYLEARLIQRAVLPVQQHDGGRSNCRGVSSTASDLVPTFGYLTAPP